MFDVMLFGILDLESILWHHLHVKFDSHRWSFSLFMCLASIPKAFHFSKRKKNRGDRCIIFGLSLIFIWLWAQMIFDDCIWDLDDWAWSWQSYGLWAFILFLLLSWVWTGTNLRHWDVLYFYFIWVWAQALNGLVWLSPISEAFESTRDHFRTGYFQISYEK